MSVISRARSTVYQISHEEISALAEYLHLDWPDAVELSRGILSRSDGVDLVGWALRDHVEKAYWRCDENEAARRQDLYRRFLDRKLYGAPGRMADG